MVWTGTNFTFFYSSNIADISLPGAYNKVLTSTLAGVATLRAKSLYHPNNRQGTIAFVLHSPQSNTITTE